MFWILVSKQFHLEAKGSKTKEQMLIEMLIRRKLVRRFLKWCFLNPILSQQLISDYKCHKKFEVQSQSSYWTVDFQ